jgi:hypothetical protein
MQVEQISVFLENKAGRLAKLTQTLKEANVNIRAFSLTDTTEFGVLRLIVNDNNAAEAALKRAGFTSGRTEVVAVEIDDKPGGLHFILTTLQDADINVEYMYAFVQPGGKQAIMIFRFEDIPATVELLQSKGIGVVDGETLYAM